MAYIYKIFFSFALFALTPVCAQAASLGFSPASGSHRVGEIFSLQIYVESSDQAMNAASGGISFSTDQLEVVSLEKNSSLFSLWAEEPTFSNSHGTVSFEGVVFNPGYTGSYGKVAVVTFRVKSPGTAVVRFSSGSVLANDGKGTNILTGFQNASLALTSLEATPAPPSAEPEQAPPKPSPPKPPAAFALTSVTHPDQDQWYANTSPIFSWSLPSGTLEVRTSISKSDSAAPSVSYRPPISQKSLEGLADGTSYFALQVRTAAGWSPVSRYRVNIDTTPPEPFSITFPNGNYGWDPQPLILFQTTDQGSGVSYYEIHVGEDGALITVPSSTHSGSIPLPPQQPGTHTVFVRAGDAAGNVRESSATFTIEAIDAPVITSYPDALEEGDPLTIRGKTNPDSEVTVFIRRGDTMVAEERTSVNAAGDFVVVIAKRLDAGTYTLTASVKDSRGAQSAETSPVTITVRPALFSRIIQFALERLSGTIVIVLAIGGLLCATLFLWFGLTRLFMHVRSTRRNAHELSERAMRSMVAHHVLRLRSLHRPLTLEERSFLNAFESQADIPENERSS